MNQKINYFKVPESMNIAQIEKNDKRLHKYLEDLGGNEEMY